MTGLIKIADWFGKSRATILFIYGLGGHLHDNMASIAEDDTL